MIAAPWGCAHQRRRLRRLFVTENLRPAAIERLWAHLRTCSECRRLYDRLAATERLLTSGGQSTRMPSAGELLRLAPRVLRRRRTVRSRSRRFLVPAFSIATATALAAVWVLVQPQIEFRPRSGAASEFAVRAFCYTSDTSGRPMVRSLSADPGPSEIEECAGVVGLAYRSARAGSLLAVAELPHGGILWLGDGEPLRIPASNELVPLPHEISPELGHRAPRVEVVFLLSESILSREQVEKARQHGSWTEVAAELDAMVVTHTLRLAADKR